jgi:hypothetical protein
VTGGDLHVAQVSASVEHGGDVRVAEHVRVSPGDLDAGGLGEVPQAAGGGVPVHPGAAAVEQDRPADPGGYVTACPELADRAEAEVAAQRSGSSRWPGLPRASGYARR